MKFFVTFLVFLLGAAPAAAQQAGSGGINRPEHRDKPYVILISLDGFKPEYLTNHDLPNLRALAQRGAVAKGMTPVFPSLTFPNHYSLVTGLHPARHGIVSNRFYDPARKQTYVYTDDNTVSDGTWYDGEPIWVTAERQGMVSACYFWPGSEAPIQGVRPTIYHQYSSVVTNETRVKAVIDWLQMPTERRPHVITLYFSDVDSASHSGALAAPAVNTATKAVDDAIGLLMKGVEQTAVRDRVYVIVTSDHGMVETTPQQNVQLGSLLDKAQLAEMVQGFSGAVANIHVRGGAPAARTLRDAIAAKLQHGQVYLREELPERYAHRTNPRSGDVIVVMDEGWTMSVPRAVTAEEAPRALTSGDKPAGPPRPRREVWGAHGWDPALPSMRALFLAVGPTIRPGMVVDEVHNVDVYPLMAELLGLTPAPSIDGRAGHIRKMISK